VVIDHREVVVAHRGITIARTSNAVRVLETSHPPTFYLPSEDVETAFLTASDGRTFCEFKGFASYWNVEVGGVVAARAAWSYPSPNPGYEALRETIAFYPGRVDACSVDGEIVEPQPGGFYGGWITSDIEGPFKGAPGTSVW